MKILIGARRVGKTSLILSRRQSLAGIYLTPSKVPYYDIDDNQEIDFVLNRQDYYECKYRSPDPAALQRYSSLNKKINFIFDTRSSDYNQSLRISARRV